MIVARHVFLVTLLNHVALSLRSGQLTSVYADPFLAVVRPDQADLKYNILNYKPA